MGGGVKSTENLSKNKMDFISITIYQTHNPEDRISFLSGVQEMFAKNNILAINKTSANSPKLK